MKFTLQYKKKFVFVLLVHDVHAKLLYLADMTNEAIFVSL